MHRLGIVVAMDVEATPIIRDHNLSRDEIHGLNFYSAPNFCIIISDVGIINATLATYIMVNELNCTNVINYGVAGLTGNLYHQRSIFSIDKIYKRDVNFTALGYDPYHFPDKPSFIQLKTDTRLPVLDCYTSDEYIGPQSVVPNNVLVDMEGYCVANVCERYNVPCMIYKSISDHTSDNDTQGQIDKHLTDAIMAISDFININILKHHCNNEDKTL
jgi:adenosylhomocysteine nucleosidase